MISPSNRRSLLLAASLLAICGCAPRPIAALPVTAAPDLDWPYYGGDAGGQRYSAAAQITPANVAGLKPAWTYSTGDMKRHAAAMKHAGFENTPILAEGRLYVCSQFNRASAVDPGTGKELWAYDPQVDDTVRYPNDNICRGVTFWRDAGAAPAEACAARIFLPTVDRRLIALDAANGKPCAGFGEAGVVDVGAGVALEHKGQFQITSPPVVVNGVVVVGSSLDDNQRVREISGAVRAFDARTGTALWSFNPLASAGPGFVAGAANVWAPMSADLKRGLVFLPTSSASPDFYGSARVGNGGQANSVVALDAATGRMAWSFQTTHHDVWDYDLPAQPTLGDVAYGGTSAPAVIQATKQGLIFTLARETGAPVVPVEERKVPQGGAPGETLSPTQPFPVAPKGLSPMVIDEKDAFGLTRWDREACRRLIHNARHEGIYTPPSLQGTILYPFTGGGVNWGGLEFDAGRQVAFVNTSSAMHIVTLIPADQVKAARKAEPGKEISPNAGAPYGMRRDVLRGPLGLPCNPPPWGQLHAIDMRTGKVLWEVPLGTTRDLAPGTEHLRSLRNAGVPNFGGPIATASGLVFIGAAMDNELRAFDAASGRELWKGRLPGGGQATPMTYVWKGRQYVVIAAGGHSKSGTKRGDQVVAFALPGPLQP